MSDPRPDDRTQLHRPDGSGDAPPEADAAGASPPSSALDDMARRWRRGERAAAEEYLARDPAAFADAEAAVELILAEVLLRQERGEAPSAGEYLARFPQLAGPIREHFELERALGGDTASVSLTAEVPDGTVDGGACTTFGGWDEPPTEPTVGGELPRPRGEIIRCFGDYELRGRLGRGGMGEVYRARQVSLNRLVALKLIRSGKLASGDERRRFHNEVEAVAQLDHPHIVPVYEVGEHEGQPYFAMKLVPGPNLAEKLGEYRGRYGDVARLVALAADAVHHAHQRGILHRDLKPANILVDEVGEPHVTDFGLAKRLTGDSDLTHTGAVLGTPAYMAPEQASGRRGSVTTSTDVYGLGAILYALLAGNAPFSERDVAATLECVRDRTPSPPSRHDPRVPRDLELICLKCLEKTASDRYHSAAGLAADLRSFLAGESVSVRAAGVLERSARWARRKPTLAAAYALGLLTLLLGGAGALAFSQWRAAEAGREREAVARAFAEELHGQQKRLAEQHQRTRDDLIGMINDLIGRVNDNPDHVLSASTLRGELDKISERTRLEFQRLEDFERSRLVLPEALGAPASRTGVKMLGD